MRTDRWGWGAARGQSEVIAVVLLLAIVIVGAGATVALGTGVLDTTSGVVTNSAAEHAMTQLDSKASLVAHGDSQSQGVVLSGSPNADRRVEPDAGWMNISVYDQNGNLETVLMNVSLGAVVYADGDTEIAYQGGGVWRQSDNGSTMVSPPEFHYRQQTLTLPLVVINGEQGIDRRVRISRNGSRRDVYPNESASPPLMNPLPSGTIVVTVGSEYYQAWGRFFEERTGGQVAMDHENETVSIDLRTPVTTDPVQMALSSSAPGDDLTLSGNGNSPAFVDSYNSSGGQNYTESRTSNGTIQTAGNVDMSGNAQVNGSIRAGGEVEMSGGSTVTGAVEWTVDFRPKGSASYASESQIGGVEPADDIDGYTQGRINSIRGTNNNNDTNAIEGEQLNVTGGTVTISEAEGTDYYVSGIDLQPGETLTIETNGNNVDIAVGDDFNMDDANVSVVGDGTVRFYVGDDVTLLGNSSVYVPDHRSPGFWLYGTDETTIDMTGSGNEEDRVTFVGTIYTPSANGGDVTLQRAEVFGSVVGGQLTIENGGVVHYDAALATQDPIPVGTNVPQVTYLHVSVIEIDVEDG